MTNTILVRVFADKDFKHCVESYTIEQVKFDIDSIITDAKTKWQDAYSGIEVSIR